VYEEALSYYQQRLLSAVGYQYQCTEGYLSSDSAPHEALRARFLSSLSAVVESDEAAGTAGAVP
jgi:hypothetical protein